MQQYNAKNTNAAGKELWDNGEDWQNGEVEERWSQGAGELYEGVE